jgi:Protein of unknown function (DUF732)
LGESDQTGLIWLKTNPQSTDYTPMKNILKPLAATLAVAALLTACGTAAATNPSAHVEKDTTTTTATDAETTETMIDLMHMMCDALETGVPVSKLVEIGEDTLVDADTDTVDVLTLIVASTTYCPDETEGLAETIYYGYPEHADAVLAQLKSLT